MKIEELINKLKTYRGDLDVKIYCKESCVYENVTEIKFEPATDNREPIIIIYYD